MVQDSEG
jgi:hypothetical protein